MKLEINVRSGAGVGVKCEMELEGSVESNWRRV